MLDDRLRRTAELSRATARHGGPAGAARRPTAASTPSCARPRSSLRLAIGDTVLLDSGVPSPAPRRRRWASHTVTLGGARYRTYAETLRDPGLGGLVRLEVATSLADLEHRRTALRRRLALIGAARCSSSRPRASGSRPTSCCARCGGCAPRRPAIATEGDLERRSPPARPGRAARARGELQRDARAPGALGRDRNRALEATRRFAADAGHELRTPLTSVQATLSAIAPPPGHAAERSAASWPATRSPSSAALVELLDSLQALARGDAAPLERADVDLGELVDASVGAAAARHPDTTLTPTRRTDAGRLPRLGAGPADPRRQPRRERGPPRPRRRARAGDAARRR